MSKTIERRVQALLPDGVPRWVRVYDNGGSTADRYTAVFTGRYRKSSREDFCYLGMSENPFHPQGVGMHGSSSRPVDTDEKGWAPAVGKKNHLGVRIRFEDLPEKCRKCVLQTYKSIWSL